jgi:uncharacterized protein (TIGR02466 family)
MQTNGQILELFPTPIYVTKLPDQLGSIVPWFYKQEMLSEEVDSPNYGERSKNSYILNEPESKELSDFLLQQIKSFGEQLGYDYDEYRFGQSWLSYKQPGQHHTMHTHPNSLISGVFYFGEPSEKTPAIKFHDMSGGFKAPTIRPKKIKDKREYRYAQETFSIEFEPGILVLFPSYLHHSVPLNKTDKVRCSLAFNSVPLRSLGEEESLTELIF